MTKAARLPSNPKVLSLTCPPGQTQGQALSRAALQPCINSASVIEAYQVNLMGKDVDLGELVEGLSELCKSVKDGDLSMVEAMLIAQATALQTIFASLARRAATQEHMRQYETFMGLALKAQAQSRATITALVDLKYPRQATFVKQANIAHGPQQVNNGAAAGADPERSAQARAHGKESQPQKNKLLEPSYVQPGKGMNARAAKTPERSYQTVEAVEQVHQTEKRRG